MIVSYSILNSWIGSTTLDVITCGVIEMNLGLANFGWKGFGGKIGCDVVLVDALFVVNGEVGCIVDGAIDGEVLAVDDKG